LIRRGDTLDIPFLRSLLAHAYGWHVNRADSDVSISRYVDAWGRPGDAALVAMDEGHSVGASWYRLLSEDAPGFGFVDDRTPELTVVVVPTRQGEGIGEQLLDELIVRAELEGYPAISVSVARDDQTEVAIYESRGFLPVAETGNAVTLVRRLS